MKKVTVIRNERKEVIINGLSPREIYDLAVMLKVPVAISEETIRFNYFTEVLFILNEYMSTNQDVIELTRYDLENDVMIQIYTLGE